MTWVMKLVINNIKMFVEHYPCVHQTVINTNILKETQSMGKLKYED